MKAILIRLAQLELKVTTVPINERMSTYVVSYNTPKEKHALDVFHAELLAKQEEIAEERRQEQAKKDAEKLASINLIRRFTFRKPLTSLPV